MNAYSGYQDLHQNSRSKFVTKVYTILSIQLSITTMFVMANIYSPTFARLQDTSRFFYVLSIIGVIVPLLALSNIHLIQLSPGHTPPSFPTT